MRIRTKRVCDSCHHVQVRIDTASHLTLDLPRNTNGSVTRSLADRFRTTPSRAHNCPGCAGAAATETTATEFMQGPEVLKIKLNLAPNTVQHAPRKKMEPVDIPSRLRLSDYAVYDPADANAQLGVPLNYRLSSVISHSGATNAFPNGGHYMITVRGQNDVYSIVDDQVFRKGQVTAQRNPGLTDNPTRQCRRNYQAYILTYTRER